VFYLSTVNGSEFIYKIVEQLLVMTNFAGKEFKKIDSFLDGVIQFNGQETMEEYLLEQELALHQSSC
jgi:hypothetical protein